MRFTKQALASIFTKKGYGIPSAMPVSAIGKGAISAKDRGARSLDDVERDSKVELEGPEVLQIRCTGKVRVRIRFYRYRLADYSRAISEKALIDALCYAGALSGDTEEEILLIDEGQVKVASREEERTELILEYPEVDFDNLWEPKKRKDGR